MGSLVDTLLLMLSYTFLQRALIVGLLVSICSSLLGVSMVLKRFAMIGDGLAHVGFGSLAVATAFNAAPLAVSLPVTVIAAFVLLRLSESGRIKGDAAIALVSASAVAIGVFVISMTTGMNTDVDNYLFGSILALRQSDVVLSVVLCVIVLAAFILLYNRIYAVTFDETFARAIGVRTSVYTTLLAILTALTIVVGMRMVGALLISSLIIFPALSSMNISKRFKSVTILAAGISVTCYLVGVIVSFVYGTPAGATIVLVNLAIFIICWFIRLLNTRVRSRG
ncbi:MAG: metal ABC transporter permease [Coriobacteriia bacterium]|nr:metal ABC transporter permease [Coriobacteriia bacterium]